MKERIAAWHDPELPAPQDWDDEIRQALNPNSEVGRKERRELKGGKGFGEPTRWTIPRTDLFHSRSFVLCSLRSLRLFHSGV